LTLGFTEEYNLIARDFMPAVLVHGVPDTHRLWDPLRSHLHRTDVIAVSLPGFDAPLPSGFAATKEAYAEWLIGEIARVGEPVDLVGHDWGALLVQRTVSLRPDLIRTWACGDGPIDVEYVWHDMAQQWQTPEVGEQIMAMMTPEMLAAGLASIGVPAAEAEKTARFFDETMKDCILRLYRSAINVGAEWQADVEKVRRPALILWSKDDPYVAPRFAERLAKRVHGDLLLLEGCGHWWPIERPAEAAAALERFWAAH
jgi:pimeloyl-ACP methyl ester carboxylesterase